MHIENASRAARRLSIACSAIVMAVSLGALIGWALDIPLLRAGFIGDSEIRPNASVALFCAALAIALVHRPIGRLLGLVPLFFGAITIAQYVTGVDFGIDTLFLDTYAPHVPVRMSVRAAVALTFAGLALLFARQRFFNHLFGGLAAFLGTLSALAYAYGATFLPHADVTPMALSTAVLVVLWGLAYFASTSESGPASMFLRGDRWGEATRRLSLIALVVPALFGAICLFEVDHEVFDVAFAVALITAGTSFTLLITITVNTARMREQEERRAAADALYRSIVETSQEGICVVGANERFTFVNERLAQMLGYTVEELMQKSSYSVVHEGDHAAVREREVVRRASGVSTRTTIRLVHRDGSTVWAISAATLVPVTPTTQELLVTLSDITERVEQEAALRASEARFRSLYETNLIGIAFWTLDGGVTDANDAFLELFDVSRSELPGWQWNMRNTPEGSATDQAMLWHLQQHGRCDPFEKEFIRADGSRFFAIIAIATIDATTNIGLVIDVTERTEARQKIERAHEILSQRLQQLEGEAQPGEARGLEALAQRVAEANEELETFSYSVSHDLRAPLRAIDGFTRELQLSYGEQLDEQGRRYLSRVRTATQRMSQLIDDLLSLSRLSRKPMNRSAVDVTTLATEVANEARERSGREVAFTIAPDLTATADPHLLRIVFENLIGNAVKFSSQRDGAHVEVLADGDGLVVRDNGAGFDPQYADKIFAPFQRLHSNEFEGTGIGLALVQRIVRRHGGSIRAESAPGQGATFTFTLSSPGRPIA